MRRGCRNLFLTIVCAVIFTMSYTCLVHAATPDDYNYDEIDTSIEEYDIDFKYLVELVMAGKYSEALRAASMSAVSGVFDGFYEQKTIFLKLFFLELLGQYLKILQQVFLKRGLPERGTI